MKLTKTFLNRFIIWTSSRYNECKKSTVVRDILEGMKNGGLISHKRNEDNTDWIEYKITKQIYHSGSYCPCSSMSGRYDYIVDFISREIIKCYVDDHQNIKQEFERVKIDEIK
jgi:hypothetical protein